MPVSVTFIIGIWLRFVPGVIDNFSHILWNGFGVYGILVIRPKPKRLFFSGQPVCYKPC